MCAPRCRWPPSWACRWWPRTRCSSSKADDFEAHEARVCVAEGETLANPKRVKRFTREQYLQDAGADGGAVCRRAQRAGQHGGHRAALQPDAGAGQAAAAGLPHARGRRQRMPLDDYFRQASFEGLEKRLLALYPDEAERERQRPTYVERLEFEIATIIKMGFPGYFMIVSDFIVWAKENGCPVGPGRGSGAGSLVAYALFITDLDPLRYKLLFERFLNPERVSMPDFDIDFCQGNRDRVIDYVKDKYGRDAVSQIATFGTMAAKAALRDVGRVLGMGYGHVDSIAKLIPAPPGKTVTLARCPTSPTAASSTRARKRPSSSSARPPTKRWPNCCAWPRAWKASCATSACMPAAC
jgi:DNA polymerase-3 subunit alpha